MKEKSLKVREIIAVILLVIYACLCIAEDNSGISFAIPRIVLININSILLSIECGVEIASNEKIGGSILCIVLLSICNLGEVLALMF